jgi:hypothetical protein
MLGTLAGGLLRIALEMLHLHARGFDGVKVEAFSLNSHFTIINCSGYEGSFTNTGGALVVLLTLTRDCLTN